MAVAWFNFARAYRRTLSSTSRRRMFYLLAGATAPALGSFPFLLFGSAIAAEHPLMFWLVAVITNTIMGGLVVVMAYAVAFFGVPWPDRVVKSRLFKWLMRGPVTACIVLALTTVVRRGGSVLAGLPYTAAVPIVMVGTILLLEYLITLFSPIWERVLFYGKDRADLLLLRTLEERLLTTNDLRQFMEMILSAVCDRFQSHNAFVAAWNNGDLELVMTTGENKLLEDENVSQELVQKVAENGLSGDYYLWGNYYLIPLIDPDSEEEPDHLLGLLGVTHQPEHELDSEQRQAMAVLSERTVLALRDRKVQQQIFHSLQSLSPDMDLIQNIRAAARYDGSRILAGEPPAAPPDLTQSVKDALTHYWGGPKLTESPLLKLEVVQQAMGDHDGNTANALRAILKEAIEKVRPEGERRFTGEWILYNILEMKFLEGRKVREIASRLAMSEADLYRKQRVAIDAVAHAIQEMEDEARKEVLDYDRTPIKGD